MDSPTPPDRADFLRYLHDLDSLVESDKSVLCSEDMAQIMRVDFRVFMWFTWKEAYGFTPHPIQLEFARLMQEALHQPTILMAMREFGKSITDAAFIDWFLFKDPNATTLVVSANFDRATEIVATALSIIKSCEFLSHLCPGKNDLDGRMAFTVGARDKIRKEASCVATSITAGNTGKHADLILSDDIEIKKNSDTQPKREKLLEGVDEYTYILNSGGTELYIGTPQTEDSVYYKLVNTGNYRLHRIPSEYPDVLNEKQMAHLADFLLEDLRAGVGEQGNPTYPERFSLEDLAKSKAKSASTYALQMLLDPSASDETKYPLKLRDCMVMELSPEYGPTRVMWNLTNPRDDIESYGLGKDKWYAPGYIDHTPAEYDRAIMGIDPAGNGPDKVGWFVGKNIHSNVFITAGGGIDGGYDEQTLKTLCQIMLEQRVNQVRIEKNFADGMYGTMLAQMMGRMNIRVPVEQVSAKGQKEVRIIETLEPVLGAHKLVIDSRVAKDPEFQYQFTHLTRDRGSLSHDDYMDALEICISGFQDIFLIDTEQRILDTKEQEFQDEIQKFMNHNKPQVKQVHTMLGSRSVPAQRNTRYGIGRRR